jgi:hypothetical protein
MSLQVIPLGINKGASPDLIRPAEEPYILINIVFAGLIMLIMFYSVIFSPDKNSYPVPCIHEKITGQPCESCGLSHSFSLILRGRISEAYVWNHNGMRVFIFFFAQLIMRIKFSLDYMKNTGNRKQLILMDSAGSFLMFLMAFIPFILFIFRWM